MGQQQAAQGIQLPETGLQAQMNSMTAFYERVKNARAMKVGSKRSRSIGFNPYENQPSVPLGRVQGNQQFGMSGGQTNIQQLARQLAERYGLPIGRDEIVDPQGNFLFTPEQLAQASGGSETMGMAAAKMGYISEAIANVQNQKQQQAAISAASVGVGLVQSRGRGSLAAMQSGAYQNIANLYANQEYESADFSFFIEEERLRLEQELQRRAESMRKKQGRFGFVGGAVLTIAGLYTGNVALVGQGVGMLSEGYGTSEWF